MFVCSSDRAPAGAPGCLLLSCASAARRQGTFCLDTHMPAFCFTTHTTVSTHTNPQDAGAAGVLFYPNARRPHLDLVRPLCAADESLPLAIPATMVRRCSVTEYKLAAIQECLVVLLFRTQTHSRLTLGFNSCRKCNTSRCQGRGERSRRRWRRPCETECNDHCNTCNTCNQIATGAPGRGAGTRGSAGGGCQC